MADSPTAAPMEGRGVYNANSALQARGAALGLKLFEKAAAEITSGEDIRAIVIADYGSSEGRNSLDPIRAAIRVLRERFGPSRAIVVTHTDLPANDFSNLFEVVDNSAESYARDDGNVFPSAVGRSFFRPVLPPSYVDLGWSSYAAMWLSRAPKPNPGHVFARSARGAAGDAFGRQGKEDWETFLTLRSQEFRRGARLIVVMPSLDENGLHSSAVLFDCANDVLADMVAEGAITGAECERMVIPSYPRTSAELLAPFGAQQQFSGFKPTHCSVTAIGDVAWAQYERDHDAEALAARRALFFRAVFAPSLARGLARMSDEDARVAFVDRLEAGVRRRLVDHLKPEVNFVATLSLEKS